MKRELIKILLFFLIGILAISCEQTEVLNYSDNSQCYGVDWVIVYQDDPSDTIPKDKVIYQVAWGNTPDTLKPKFNLNFCKDNLQYPYYFPEKDQLKGKAGHTIAKIDDEHLEPELQTTYSMTYDKDGRIVKYSILGPSIIYSCDIVFDNQNRIQQISDGWKKLNIVYNDFDNIETIVEISSEGKTIKTLKFIYTYVSFSRC